MTLGGCSESLLLFLQKSKNLINGVPWVCTTRYQAALLSLNFVIPLRSWLFREDGFVGWVQFKLKIKNHCQSLGLNFVVLIQNCSIVITMALSLSKFSTVLTPSYHLRTSFFSVRLTLLTLFFLTLSLTQQASQVVAASTSDRTGRTGHHKPKKPRAHDLDALFGKLNNFGVNKKPQSNK